MAAKISVFLLVTVWLLAGNAGVCAQEVETFDCATTTGWAVPGADPKTSSLSANGAAIVWKYDRTPEKRLVHGALLTELEEIRFTLRSESDAILGLVIPDRDGRVFFKLLSLKAGKSTTARILPGDLRPLTQAKDQSPLDPKRLGAAYVLVDKTPGGGGNTITIDEVRVTRKGIPRKKESWTVDEDRTVSENVFIEGDITVTDGARLRITAPQFGLGGDLTIEDGIVEVSGAAFLVPQRFNHERKITLSGSSLLVLRGAVVSTIFPVSVRLTGEATLDGSDTFFAGGMTCATGPGTTVRLEDVTSPGEFIVVPGAHVSLTGSSGGLLWLAAGPNMKGTFTLPSAGKIDDWTGKHGWTVSVKRSTGIGWGLVSMAGSEATFKKSAFRAVGLHFGGKTETTLSGIHNGEPLPGGTVDAADRSLRFTDSPVGVWNVYTALRATLTLTDSTIGEAIAFMDSRMEIRDTVLDGTGGYVCAHHTSEIRLVNCTIRSLVVAREKSTILLENCRIHGDVLVADTATVKLVGCTVDGQVEKDPGATLIRE